MQTDINTATMKLVREELRNAFEMHNLLKTFEDVNFGIAPDMPVTRMRRCLKHGRQRLQCNRPHAPLSLCERVIGPLTLAEFGHWLQLLYHLRRFVKGVVRGKNVGTATQTSILREAQNVLMLSLKEPNEEELWNMDYSRYADAEANAQAVFGADGRSVPCDAYKIPPLPGASAVTPVLNKSIVHQQSVRHRKRKRSYEEED